MSCNNFGTFFPQHSIHLHSINPFPDRILSFKVIFTTQNLLQEDGKLLVRSRGHICTSNWIDMIVCYSFT